MLGCMFDLVDYLGVHAVEQSSKNRFARVPNNSENPNRNKYSNRGIGQRIAQPEADSADQHRQAGEAIDASVITVCNEGGTADLLTDPDAEDRHSFVTCKSNYGRYGNGPQIFNSVGVQQSVNRL